MIKIENTEVKTWDRHESSMIECGIKGTVFTCLRNEKTVFNSEIYKYGDLNIVVAREPRYGEFYYNIAAYNSEKEKAWALITVSTKLTTCIKRLDADKFVIWTDLPGNVTDIKQCTFCTIHDSEKQDSITIDFNILHSINILPGNNVLLCFSQILGGQHVEQSTITALALHEPSGKFIKTIYEYDVKDANTFDFSLNMEAGEIVIQNKEKGTVKGEKTIKFADLVGGAG